MANLQLVVALGVVVNEEGKVLLSRRIDKLIPEAHNKWELPGGKIKFGEDPESAVVREVFEETGLEVAVTKLLPVIYTNVFTETTGQNVHVILIAYQCNIVSGSASNRGVEDEIGELAYFTPKEAGELPLLPKVKELISYIK